MRSKNLLDVLALGAAPSGRSLKAAVGEWIGKTISLTDGDFWSAWLAGSNWSGQTVNTRTALQVSAAWACVRLIAETLSTLPMGLYRTRPDGSKEPASSHHLYTLLRSQPNADMSAVDFWQAMLSSLLLWGNAYAEKRLSGGIITSIDFLNPERISCRRLKTGAREWKYDDPITGRVRVIAETAMWHIPAFTLDGQMGVSPIRMGANVFGGAIAADKASAHTFTGGMKSSGLVTTGASVLKPDQREDIRQHVKKVSDTGGVMVLEMGMGFQQLNMNPQDAELLATRGFNVEEVCRWFRVPPFMVGHSEKSTSWGTGIEQQMIGFITFVLRPWCVRIEQSIRRNLLSPVERLTHSAEWSLEGLLRGDSAARAAFYSQMVQNGVMTRDDARRLENLPLMGGNANVLTVQSNLLPIDALGVNAGGAAAQDALRNWLGINDEKDPKP
ncbi:phage portal protein, HK97 family [Paenacidovorax caeni]|uniref:Phage portal protein, HK97 family n=1 Tax=Paenacidovorax caeni TaxID=343013 RepID=A0A1I7J9B3_9BURK|nr:phage portal protein [Paenacidovorax caeni]SFU81757.1 phage portal protein, HK97 family [Paenacidovorax caeni]